MCCRQRAVNKGVKVGLVCSKASVGAKASSPFQGVRAQTSGDLMCQFTPAAASSSRVFLAAQVGFVFSLQNGILRIPGPERNAAWGSGIRNAKSTKTSTIKRFHSQQTVC